MQEISYEVLLSAWCFPWGLECANYVKYQLQAHGKVICFGKAHVSGARQESGCFGDINRQYYLTACCGFIYCSYLAMMIDMWTCEVCVCPNEVSVYYLLMYAG